MTLLADLGWLVVEMLAQLFHVIAFVGEKCVFTGFHIYRAAALLIWPVLRTLSNDVCHTAASAYTSWVAHRLSGAVTSVEPLLSMVVAHVWALLDPVLTPLRPTAVMVSHAFTWTTSVLGYRVVAFCCGILVVTMAVVVCRKVLKCTGVADHGMVVMVQLVNQWLASFRGRLQARGAQFGQHVTEGGTQTVEGDEVEAPRVRLREKQLCSACTGVEAALQRDHGGFCCVVCYTNKKEWMVRPCNHVCLCFECTTENIHHLHDRCPMCRGEILRVEKVYF